MWKFDWESVLLCGIEAGNQRVWAHGCEGKKGDWLRSLIKRCVRGQEIKKQML